MGTSSDNASAADRLLQELCLDHASDLIASAQRVLDGNGFPNIAYHLAILALEEIGKGGMIASRMAVGAVRDTDWIEKKLDDHVWKLQWAVWSPSLAGGRLNPKDFEEARRFAQSTHARRLASLYVNADKDNSAPLPPRDAVSLSQVTSVLDLARVRLELAGAEGRPIPDGNDEYAKWFLETTTDPGGSKLLFSKPFVDKHEEFRGDTRAWVIWAKEEFGKIEAEAQARLALELERLPSAAGANKPKWVIRVRLYTPSHSIRPKALKYWNDRIEWIKMIAVSGKKNEIMLEITMHDHIPLPELYDAGLSLSKLIIAVINIGTLGFFWYDLPRQPAKYYETIKDLESPNMDVTIEKSKGLRTDWKQGALTEKNLHHAIDCLIAYAHMPDSEAAPIFGPYLEGLVLLSKCDVHLSCEPQAKDAFIRGLKAAMHHFRDWDRQEDALLASLHKVFAEIIPEQEHRNIIFAPLKGATSEGALADAISAKRITDLYLVLTADRIKAGQIRPTHVNA